jgi:hypothetical protein
MNDTLVGMVTCDITPGCQVIVEVEKDYIVYGVRTEAEETVSAAETPVEH